MTKNKFSKTTFLAFIVAVSLLLSACSLTNLLEALLVPNPVPFSQIEYVRPSYDQLREITDTALDALRMEASYFEIVNKLNDFFTAYSTFLTMETLADIRYTTNTQLQEYLIESNYFTEHSMLVNLCREEILIACANSASSEQLESLYFQSSLEEYRDYARYTNAEYFELAKQEVRLIEEYRITISDATVNGERFAEQLANAETAEEYNRLLSEFYTKYTPIITDLYHRMIITRKEMARVIGYDNYLELAAENLGRSFSTESVNGYLTQLRSSLPILSRLDLNTDLEPLSVACNEERLYSLLNALCTALDKNESSTRFFSKQNSILQTNGLCDLTLSPYKESISFTTYLYDYYEPYIVISPTGTLSDFSTLTHEFGHFCDMNYTSNALVSIDLAEVYSSGLSMLSLFYLDDLGNSALTKQECEAFLAYETLQVAEVMQSQGMLSDFEMAIYDPESRIDTSNPEELCALYRAISNEWGYQIQEDQIASAGWIAIPHIFQYPTYVFSYCISMDAALQLYNLEMNKIGDGISCYVTLLNRDTTADFTAVLESAGLESPFEPDHLTKLFTAFIEAASA